MEQKTFQVINLNDSGEGSFREALIASNKEINSNISLNITGSITIESELPDITSAVFIGDETKAPKLQLDFQNTIEGLKFVGNSHASKLFGLVIINTKFHGIKVCVDNMIFDKLSIGIDLFGNIRSCGGDGILFYKSNHNQIGLSNNLESDYVSNIISGNKGNGIYFYKSNYNKIQKNTFGADIFGQFSQANCKSGLLFNNSSHNLIGGTLYTNAERETNDPTGNKGTETPVFIILPLANLISGNKEYGVCFMNNSENNTMNGNFIGSTLDGNFAIGNGKDGVVFSNSNNNSLIGCTTVENPFVYYNVISGNGGNGIRIIDSNNTKIQGNFIGINSGNTYPLPNLLNGILVEGCSNSTIVGGNIPLGNCISGNGKNGIHVKDKASDFISFNTFSGLCAFGGVCPNRENGILITSSGENIVLRTNVCSGNGCHGIELSGYSSKVNVDPNIVGAVTNGNATMQNGKSGLCISENSSYNKIESNNTSVIPYSLFSGNLCYGIEITDNAHHNIIDNCNIGLNVTRSFLLSNNRGCIKISKTAHNNIISNNYISNNYNFSIFIGKDTCGNKLIDNIIGKNIFDTSIGTEEGNRIIYE